MTRIGTMSEADFMAQVTDLAGLLGWQWAHFRPARTATGWRTPVSGTLGAGWPDLTLVRERDRRLIFAELKRDGATTTPEQDRVLGVLLSLAWIEETDTCIQVCVWQPHQFDVIAEILR